MLTSSTYLYIYNSFLAFFLIIGHYTVATGLVYVFQALLFYRSLNARQGYASVLAMDWYGNETLHNTPLSNITLDGTPIAAVANVDNFSFAYVLVHCSS